MVGFELGNEATLEGMSLIDKISNGAFQATTARTAGFSSIDFAETRMGTDFLFMLLMFTPNTKPYILKQVQYKALRLLSQSPCCNLPL